MTSTLAVDTVPFLTWEQFLTVFVWRQGEHVAMIGPTGRGKTTMGLAILPRRRFVTVLATKPKDDTLEHFAKTHDYRRMTEWNWKLSPVKYPRRLLWPSARSLYANDEQKRVFQEALASIYEQGSWCVFIDEGWILAQTLGMAHEIKTYEMQGRSNDISTLFASQRPAWIPLEVYDMSTHLFFWADNDETNLSRISGISYGSSRMIQEIVATLGLHEVLYINTRLRIMYRTMSPPPSVLQRR